VFLVFGCRFLPPLLSLPAMRLDRCYSLKRKNCSSRQLVSPPAPRGVLMTGGTTLWWCWWSREFRFRRPYSRVPPPSPTPSRPMELDTTWPYLKFKKNWQELPRHCQVAQAVGWVAVRGVRAVTRRTGTPRTGRGREGRPPPGVE